MCKCTVYMIQSPGKISLLAHLYKQNRGQIFSHETLLSSPMTDTWAFQCQAFWLDNAKCLRWGHFHCFLAEHRYLQCYHFLANLNASMFCFHFYPWGGSSGPWIMYPTEPLSDWPQDLQLEKLYYQIFTFIIRFPKSNMHTFSFWHQCCTCVGSTCSSFHLHILSRPCCFEPSFIKIGK